MMQRLRVPDQCQSVLRFFAEGTTNGFARSVKGARFGVSSRYCILPETIETHHRLSLTLYSYWRLALITYG